MSFAPLHGIRVVDLTSSLAGPTCTQILGALGADVVKVEHPQRGDEARAWGPQFFEGGSVMFFAANASKRSLALDFKDAARAWRRCCGSSTAPTSSSSRCGRARRSGSGSAATRCARGTSGSSTARSARSAATGRSRGSPATTR